MVTRPEPSRAYLRDVSPSRSTAHPLPFGVVCRRWAEDVRAKVMPADAGCGFDREDVTRRHLRRRYPARYSLGLLPAHARQLGLRRWA